MTRTYDARLERFRELTLLRSNGIEAYVITFVEEWPQTGWRARLRAAWEVLRYGAPTRHRFHLTPQDVRALAFEARVRTSVMSHAGWPS
jgi:hypothetical protein